MTSRVDAHARQARPRLNDQVVVTILVEVSNHRRPSRNVRQAELSDDLSSLRYDCSIVHSHHEDVLSSKLVRTQMNHLKHRHHVDVDGRPHILSRHERVTWPIDAYRSRLHPVCGSLNLPVETSVIGVGGEKSIADQKDCVQHVDASIRLIPFHHALEYHRRSSRQLLLALEPSSSHAHGSLRDALDHVAVLGGGGADGLVEENVCRRSAGCDPCVALRVEGVADEMSFGPNNGSFTDDCFEPVNRSILVDVRVHHVGRKRKFAERSSGVEM
mmetsp:Transcript_8667/g.19658  ORF Transcript_8667/g.19658 Transcript_8667/m.19658 type:complete len:272 (-) Transcript_8667:1422-2237(-)